MDLQDQGGVGGAGCAVVAEAGAVRRPDLDEAGTGLGHDLGDPEAAADLHELAPGHEHLLPPGQRGEREQHGGGVVVDDEPGVGAARLGEEVPSVVVAGPPPAGLEAVLQVRVAAPDVRGDAEGLLAEGGTAQVRVQEHPGGVDDGAELAGCERGDACLGVAHHGGGVDGRGARAARGPGRVDGLAGAAHEERARQARELGEDTLDARQGAPGVRHGASVGRARGASAGRRGHESARP